MKNKLANLGEILNKSPATIILIALNIVVFFILRIFPATSEILLLTPDKAVFAQKPWSLITVFFSHEVIIHLILNMFILFVFGTAFEQTADKKHLIIVYFLAGFSGSLTFIPYAPLIGWTGPVVGASASAFGVATLFSATNPNALILKSKSKNWAIALFVVNLLIAVANPETSVGAPAHIVGLIVGSLYGLWLKKREKSALPS